MKQLQLEDLTKEELLRIIHRYFLEVPQHHIIEARRDSLNQRANEIMGKAQKRMEANIGGRIANIRRFQEASKEFDSGMALADKATELWEQMMLMLIK